MSYIPLYHYVWRDRRGVFTAHTSCGRRTVALCITTDTQAVTCADCIAGPLFRDVLAADMEQALLQRELADASSKPTRSIP